VDGYKAVMIMASFNKRGTIPTPDARPSCVAASHQDARYIPRRREQDRTPRGWQDRFAVRRLVLAAVVMVVVALVTFMLIYGHA
jgi:hypothetical protein